MPELPEIITIRNDLKKHVVGKKITKVKTFNNYPLDPSESHFEKHVVDHRIVSVLNISKLLALKLSSNYFLASHLRMTGNILFNQEDPYIKISIVFDDGDKLHYSSVRKFGFFEVWDENKLNEYSGRQGFNPLDVGVTNQAFAKTVWKRNTNIKNALLDQTLIGGIGNIYANDALYLSKINPKQNTKSLNQKELSELFKNVRLVLKEGIKNRGSSIDRFKDIHGKQGRQQYNFKVYDRKGENCNQCNKGEIVYEKIQGRGTYYCPNCQPQNLKN